MIDESSGFAAIICVVALVCALFMVVGVLTVTGVALWAWWSLPLGVLIAVAVVQWRG